MHEQWSASDPHALQPLDDQPTNQGLATLHRLLRGRYRWAILLALLLAIGAGAATYIAIEPVYRSSASLRIAPEVRPILYTTEATSLARDFDAYLDAQVALMQSRHTIERALYQQPWTRLGLDASPERMSSFAEHLHVEREQRGQIAYIHFTDEDPDIAAAGAESALTAFQQIYREQYHQQDARIQQQLEERRYNLERQQQQLNNQRDRITNPYGVRGIQQRTDLLLNRLDQAEQMLRHVNTTIQSVENADEIDIPHDQLPYYIAQHDPQMRQLLTEQQQIQNELEHLTASGLGPEHRSVRPLLAHRQSLSQRIDQHIQSLDHHIPVPQDPLAPVAPQGGPDAGLAGPQQPASPLAMPDLQQLRARQADLQRINEQLHQSIAGMTRINHQIARLDHEQQNLQQRIAETDQRLEELRTESPFADRIEIINWPAVPDEPHNLQRRMQYTAAASLTGTGLGVGIIMLMGLLDRRIRRADDTHPALGSVRVLGVLPTLPEDMPAPQQAALTAHCVHHIRSLLQINHQQPGRTYAITSTTAAAGKTSLTTALGLSFATTDTRVLLIDADLIAANLTHRLHPEPGPSFEKIIRNQQLVPDELLQYARYLADFQGQSLAYVLVENNWISPGQARHAQQLQRQQSPGLLDAHNPNAFEHTLTETGLDNLYLLPAGCPGPEHAGSLSHKHLQRVLELARPRFDIILIDTGPILGSIEASLAAAQAHGTLLLVSRGDEKSLLQQSINHLKDIHATLTGVIFNHASPEDMRHTAYPSSVVSLRPDPDPPDAHAPAPADADPRLGPIGSAVASHNTQRTTTAE